jgi:pimeloyl-ACP methyl ester carboxylesterase
MSRIGLLAIFCLFTALTPANAQLIPPPTKSVVIGNMHFDRYGQGEPALIVLPSLSVNSWTWSSAIAEMSADHTIYAANMAGFDGLPPAPPPYISQADAAVMNLIRQENLKEPVLVGHSLGGHIALRLLEEHPDLFAGAVIVDETPYFPPPQPGQTLQQRAQNVSQLADGIASAPDWLYESQTRSTAATMVTDSALAQIVADHSLRSDRTTLAGATSEMSLEDLRPGLSKITAPLLVVAPVSADAPYMNPQLRALTPTQLAATIHDYYASQYAGAKTVTVETIANSKHFIMLDQPDALNAAIKNFLTVVTRPPSGS